jgi:predicted membrane chloride channel (bestrophin family)
LRPEEIEWVASWNHKPLGAAAVLSRILRQVSMPEYSMLAVDEQIVSYVNLVGACERINRTAIPQAYTRCALSAKPYFF